MDDACICVLPILCPLSVSTRAVKSDGRPPRVVVCSSGFNLKKGSFFLAAVAKCLLVGDCWAFVSWDFVVNWRNINTEWLDHVWLFYCSAATLNDPKNKACKYKKHFLSEPWILTQSNDLFMYIILSDWAIMMELNTQSCLVHIAGYSTAGMPCRSDTYTEQLPVCNVLCVLNETESQFLFIFSSWILFAFKILIRPWHWSMVIPSTTIIFLALAQSKKTADRWQVIMSALKCAFWIAANIIQNFKQTWRHNYLLPMTVL